MPKTEDGEFELILGNRQLLSVFFIVVVLLGVFFTMGYIVGRNSAPAGGTDLGRANEPKPALVDRQNQPSPAGEPIVQMDRNEPAGGEGTRPPQTPAPEQPKPRTERASPPPTESRPVEPPPAAKSKPAPPPASQNPGEPQAGAYYLQVAAVARPEAELFVDVLARRGFNAIYVQHPDQALYRVLVGPFRDTAAVSQARTDLNNAGFKGFGAIQRRF
jgi:cell division septation protein DedD